MFVRFDCIPFSMLKTTRKTSLSGTTLTGSAKIRYSLAMTSEKVNPHNESLTLNRYESCSVTDTFELMQ